MGSKPRLTKTKAIKLMRRCSKRVLVQVLESFTAHQAVVSNLIK